MSRLSNRSLIRIAATGALVAALGLAGCGRKGGLDPPPAAGITEPGTTDQPGAQSGVGPDGRPVAAQGQRKRIFLDWLID